MTEVLFYHLTEHKLEQTLPGLLERSLERGWRVVVQCGNEQLKDALDTHLWTWRDESFLPHGCAPNKNSETAEASGTDIDMTDDQGKAVHQPIWLTCGNDNPNQSHVRFVVGNAVPKSAEGLERLIYIFDGLDDDAVQLARDQWKVEKQAGHDLTYWQQDETGRWSKKAGTSKS